MNPVNTQHLSTVLIFDYAGAESNQRMSNVNPHTNPADLRAFAQAVNTLQRVNANGFIKETRTQLSA